MVNRDEVLRKLLQYWPVTVFAPTNDAVEKSNEWIVGRENKVVSYHVLNQVAEKASFPFKSPTSLAGSPPLYLQVKEGPWKDYFVNNAKILRSEDYISQDGTKQLLYVIDEILQPYVSSTSLPPTALDLLDKPELYDIREPLSAFDFRVKQEGLQELFMREGNNTFFLPVGAGVGHSFNRQQEVDKWVIRGHVIPRTILFTRLVSFDSYPSEAYGDDIKVELTIINESNAMGNSYSLYAQSNTIHSDYRHKKGVVMAKILKPNIPVKNGVVHLIESPLMIIDITVWKFLQNEKDGRLSEFLDLVNYAPDFKEILMSSQEKTLFAPSNEAIRQLPAEAVATIKTNITAITNLLKLHLVMKSVSTDDVLYGRYKDFISADNRNSLYFRILGDEKNKTLTVDGVGVKAAAIQADIGAVDGMVHIIDRLLGMPYQTVYLKLASDPDLKITYELAEQDDWASLLNAYEKRFTFFVPGNEAWEQLRNEMPTELDRHLVVNRELRSTDLERLKDIQMVHGNFKVIHSGYPNGKRNISGGLPPLGELLLEWEGLQARIIRPDVQAVNGVIHVIDRVMMKRRDLTKSESSIGPRCTGFLVFIPRLYSSRHLVLKTNSQRRRTTRAHNKQIQQHSPRRLWTYNEYSYSPI
ncbi:Fasciclin-1 like protein [Argiope bruennichi]|uniref:Fasciclin-1 like protein n=1 Tax=Argiope bruennichi TaxID=94029 RepID=A0A8T0EQ17_ARGBR|nr:Fasciclin-1 like protein [Argiope bruennichi]